MGYIVVSGEWRTGTSLMMQLLKALNLNVSGEKFLRAGKDDRVNEHRNNNPRGFYEVPYLVHEGIKDKTEYLINGNVVKLILIGLLKTDKKFIDKIILCIRNPREMVSSKLKAVAEPTTYQQLYKNHNRRMTLFIKNTPPDWWRNRILVVDYKDMILDSQNQINRVCSFLGVVQMDNAGHVIDPSLYRSKADIPDHRKSREIYNWLRRKINVE